MASVNLEIGSIGLKHATRANRLTLRRAYSGNFLSQINEETIAETWLPEVLSAVNATIQPFKQLRCSDGERVTNVEHSRQCDWPTRLNLLPMAGGKAKPNHVFLGEAVGFAQPLYSLTKSAKELFLIDQACLLGDS